MTSHSKLNSRSTSKNKHFITSNNSDTSLTAILSRPPETPPAEYQILRKFNKRTIANYLNINTGYLSNILSGYKTPGEQLHNILVELAKTIEAEAVNSGNGGNGAVNAVNGEGGLN